jgi:hypothetical protein
MGVILNIAIPFNFANKYSPSSGLLPLPGFSSHPLCFVFIEGKEREAMEQEVFRQENRK